MLKCVVFDMDGTLLDTEKLSVQFWMDMGKEYGVDLPLDFVLANCGRPRVDILRRFQEHYPTLPAEEAITHRDEWWAAQAAKGLIHPKPGAAETLSRLREIGLKLAVATSNAQERAELELADTGLSPFLDSIVSKDILPSGRGKPAPDIFLLAMEKMGCTPEESMVVEDSESGVLGGMASGARTVMIPDQLQPSGELRGRLYRCLDSLTELIPVAEELVNRD